MSLIFKKPTHDTSASNDSGVTSFVYVYPEKFSANLSIAKKWQIQPTFMPSAYAGLAETIYDLTVRPDDTWIVSYPKCGTTWTQEMVWLLVNDLNYEMAAQVRQHERYHFMEREALNKLKAPNSIRNTAEAPSPRFIKSHLPATLLPNGLWTVRPKIVYVARNPKDAAVSRYHFYTKFKGWHGTFDDFMRLVLGDQLVYSPFHNHVTNFWNIRDEENVLFLTYEEMKVNLMDVLRRTASFFGKSYEDAELLKLEQHLSFDKMKADKSNLLENIK